MRIYVLVDMLRVDGELVEAATPSESVHAPTLADPIDMTHLRVFTDGDIEEERALFELFIKSATSCIAELDAAIVAEATETWRKSSHLLKGASGNLGANMLYSICAESEKNFTASAEDKQAMLGAIRDEMIRVQSFIQQLQSPAPHAMAG